MGRRVLPLGPLLPILEAPLRHQAVSQKAGTLEAVEASVDRGEEGAYNFRLGPRRKDRIVVQYGDPLYESARNSDS